MRFCQKYRIHLISDEIYGLSVWDNPESPDESGFHSALSIDPQGLIDSELVHVLWGIAKVCLSPIYPLCGKQSQPY